MKMIGISSQLIQYLKHIKKDRLTLEADESVVANWHVDASFRVHTDMRSHTGLVQHLENDSNQYQPQAAIILEA